MKQAFLIIAHSQFHLLKTLIELLTTDSRSDVYIHIDKKSNIPLWLKYSIFSENVYFLKERIDTRWGDFSQIETELLLFKTAFKNGPYKYYHILSGVDLPIKPISKILDFFDSNEGKEFVGYAGGINNFTQFNKVLKYHFFTRKYGKSCHNIVEKVFWKLLRVMTESIVNAFVKRDEDMHFRLGHNWVSITNAFCGYLLSKENLICKRFRFTFCADEIFIQTLLYDSSFKKNIYDGTNNNDGSKREIDWNRGGPYVWGQSDEDFEILKNSKQMFARKFDEKLSARFIPLVIELVNQKLS